MSHTPLATLCVGAVVAMACSVEEVGDNEMRSAVDEMVASGDAHELESDLFDLTTATDDAPDGAARRRHLLRDRMHELIASQIPCSTLTRVGDDTLVIDFGTLEDECTFRGRTWAGVVTVSYAIEGESTIVKHAYDGVTDGRAEIDGTAVVIRTQEQRHVVTEFVFDGPRGRFTSSSDRVHRPLADDAGVQIDGTRDWQRERGRVHVDIDGVEVRRGDSVPQDGSFVITRPDGREMTMTFARVDDDTILVTVTGGERERSFEVGSDGDIRELLARDRRDRRR